MRSPFLSLLNISAGAGDGAAETASIRFDSDQTDARNGSARIPIPAPTSQLIRTACARVPLLRKAKPESWVCDRRSYAADAAIAALCSSRGRRHAESGRSSRQNVAVSGWPRAGTGQLQVRFACLAYAPSKSSCTPPTTTATRERMERRGACPIDNTRGAAWRRRPLPSRNSSACCTGRAQTCLKYGGSKGRQNQRLNVNGGRGRGGGEAKSEKGKC